MELFEEFLSENAKYDRSTKAAYRQAARWFSEFVGEENSVRMAFTRTNAREFKKLLKLAPIRADQAGAFKSLKFPQFIRANESVGKPTISDQRINLILRGCNSFARWLTSHGYIDDSPFVGLTLTINTEGTKYPPFTIEELNTLAQSPVFTGALNEKSIHRPGNVMIRDHRYWLWLLALFTGARLGELGLLVPDDIHEFKGVSVIKMPTEKQRRGGVSIDPRERARPVPVHEELIKCGFIDYAHRMKSAGESKLFPKIKSSSSGDLMGEESKRLNRYLKNIGIKTGDRRVVFHSTRGTFVDAARRGGVRQADYDLLIKLGESTVTRRHYGEELEGTIEQRTEWMSKIKYDKLNLSHLYVP